MKYILMAAAAAVLAGCGSADNGAATEINGLKANIAALQAANTSLKTEVATLSACNAQMARFISFVFPQPGLFQGVVTSDEMVQKAQAFRAACASAQ